MSKENGKIGLDYNTLEECDIVCPSCDGLGTEFVGSMKIASLCHRCGGEGKLDWLERLFGKTIDQDGTRIVWNDKRSFK